MACPSALDAPVALPPNFGLVGKEAAQFAHLIHGFDAFLAAYAPQARALVSFDIDGTLACINARLALAPGQRRRGEQQLRRTAADWDTVLAGEHYHLDEPIEAARKYVTAVAEGGVAAVAEGEGAVAIVYLSGRRAGTEQQTREWFERHGFPPGFVLHRAKGLDSRRFKRVSLGLLRRRMDHVLAHFGDRPADDGCSALAAGVRPVVVLPNEWVGARHIHGGLAATAEQAYVPLPHMQRRGSGDSVQRDELDALRRCHWWAVSYSDLVPLHYAAKAEGSPGAGAGAGAADGTGSSGGGGAMADGVQKRPRPRSAKKASAGGGAKRPRRCSPEEIEAKRRRALAKLARKAEGVVK